jgi:hypothetical protein
MGLKGYRLWVMGQLESTCNTAPPRRRHHVVEALALPLALGDFVGETPRALRFLRLHAAPPPRCSAARCNLKGTL